MRLHERRVRSRFQRSLSDKHYYGMNRKEEEELRDQEIKEQIAKEEYRNTVARREPRHKMEMGPTIMRFLPIVIIAAIVYFLADTYLF